MAINFLNTVNLNKNQLNQAAIENLGTDPATGVLGQIYYNTTDSALKICITASTAAPSNAVWQEVGTTSGVETFTNANGTYVSAATVNTSAIGDVSTGIIDLSAVDGTSTAADRFLTKANKWATIPFGDITEVQSAIATAQRGIKVTSPAGPIPVVGLDIIGQTNLGATAAANDELIIYDLSTTTNKSITVANLVAAAPQGDVTDVNGGTYITTVNPGGPVVTVNHDATTRTNTSTASSPGYGGDIVAVKAIGTNATGHVTSVATETYTLPNDTNETYTLPVAAGASNSAIMNLTAGGTGSGVKSSVTVFGTTGRIAISEQTGNNGSITVDFPDSVEIVDNLTVGGVITQSQTGETNYLSSPLDMNTNKLQRVATGTVGTDGVNLAQVELLVAGVGVFQGGYDASTDPGTPAVSGGSNVALDQGDYFVVTAGGDITFSDTTVTVEVGDFIFANAAITASSTPASTQYTIVIADDNIATANTTAANTQKGVAGFDSAYFDVTTGADAGWVQLNSQRNPYGASQTLDNTSPVVRVESGGLTTFTIDLADATLFGASALAKNVTAEVTQNVSPYQTVYADVTRSGTASMSIVFSGSVAVDIYRVLLSHI